MANSLRLADLHIDLLFERDDSGHLLRSRDHSIEPPLFHLVRTTTGNRWLVSAALTEEERTQLQIALASEPVLAHLVDFEEHPPLLNGVRSLLAIARPGLNESSGPVFGFPDQLPPLTQTIEILADPSHVPVVPELEWLRTASIAEQPIAVARNSDSEAVAICHSARSTGDAAEAGVETANAYRGRGLAGAVVVAWAAAVRAEGRIPIYSTQWSNLASRSVARKLGLIPFGEDFAIG